MAYEFKTDAGMLRLLRQERQWVVHFNGAQGGAWRSPDAAAQALARHRSGLTAWDTARADVSGDVIDWRPLGESL
jgi:hypothetical protein